MKVNEIYEGWKNHLAPEEQLAEQIRQVSDKRMAICKSCPHHSSKHSTPLRFDEHCTHCGCTLIAKTKCLSCECPIGKWKAINNIENGQ